MSYKVTGTGASFVFFKGIEDPLDVKKENRRFNLGNSTQSFCYAFFTKELA
jgi:hypothetical protein